MSSSHSNIEAAPRPLSVPRAEAAAQAHSPRKWHQQPLVQALQFFAILYVFFICIQLFGTSFKLFGRDAAASVLQVTANPFVGLLIGTLVTSLIQSSSTTTSMIVALVAAGGLSVESAIPMIMGANIGTTITNTIVSMGHLRHRGEFKRAFAGAVVHDFFNLCAVALFLPIELLFHPIQTTATWLTGVFTFGGAEFSSPFKAITKPVTEALKHGVLGLGLTEIVAGVVLTVLSLVLLIVSLSQIVRIMRGALSNRFEALVDRVLFTTTFRALLIGIGLTALVQSSSVTTSLVIPMIGAGIVSLRAAFPYMVGANIGTTVTALLAALAATGEFAIFGVTIALCHLVFNIFGTVVFLPLAKIPIALAEKFGAMAAKRRWLALVYVLGMFFGLPALFVLL